MFFARKSFEKSIYLDRRAKRIFSKKRNRLRIFSFMSSLFLIFAFIVFFFVRCEMNKIHEGSVLYKSQKVNIKEKSQPIVENRHHYMHAAKQLGFAKDNNQIREKNFFVEFGTFLNENKAKGTLFKEMSIYPNLFDNVYVDIGYHKSNGRAEKSTYYLRTELMSESKVKEFCATLKKYHHSCHIIHK